MDSKAHPKACDHYDRHSVCSNNAVASRLGSATSANLAGGVGVRAGPGAAATSESVRLPVEGTEVAGTELAPTLIRRSSSCKVGKPRTWRLRRPAWLVSIWRRSNWETDLGSDLPKSGPRLPATLFRPGSSAAPSARPR